MGGQAKNGHRHNASHEKKYANTKYASSGRSTTARAQNSD